ncbi:hypothetical protein RO3G_01818 [Lichtheimia corymbifera JMRC:FSU:9682]|uniref:K Homology domain-containing protein n=1 Tax=Lichtheimia corymbifera JMRC:FSU:9682 TaxID=1263082 RepID=A0A068REP8_9FUNG|nr:hypothetical protein RO3G_01818 [Lichtheimia corymbifera JMRC:FSU:9682]
MLRWRLFSKQRLVTATCRVQLNHAIQPSKRVSTRRHFHSSRFVRENEPDRADRLFKQLISEQHEAPASDFIQSIEAIRPKSKKEHVLTNERYDSLVKQLNEGFTVPQLREYLQTQHHRVSKQHRKQQIIDMIIRHVWGFESREMVRQQAIKKKMDSRQRHCKTNRQELFFIIGEDGDTLRAIEEKHNVQITVLADMNQYMIEGYSRAVDAARMEIKEYLSSIVNDHINMPPLKEGVVIEDVLNAIKPFLPYISKETKAFITIQEDKLTLAARSNNDIDHAKWLLAKTLADLDLTTTQSLDAADDLYIQLSNESDKPTLSFTPIHDAKAMPVTVKHSGWSRITLGRDEKSIAKGLYHLESEKKDDWVNDAAIRRIMMESLPETVHANISLEARFGNVLFENPAEASMRFLTPPLHHHFSTQKLHDYISTSKRRHIFFPSQPPPTITRSFLPVISAGSSPYRRRVVLEYVSKYLLPNFGGQMSSPLPSDQLKRLQIEFMIQDDGDLELERVMGEYNRSTIDIIGLEKNVDLRLLAKQYVLFAGSGQTVPGHLVHKVMPAELQEAVDQCELTGYTDFDCLPSLKLDDMGTMDLLEVSFRDEARYKGDNETEDVMLTISDVDTQKAQTRHTELMITPITHDTMGSWKVPENGLESWLPFRRNVRELSKRWKFINLGQ